MIKIFSMLSVMFALLAGFSACGSVKNDGSAKPDTEQTENDPGAEYNDKDPGTEYNDNGPGTEYNDNGPGSGGDPWGDDPVSDCEYGIPYMLYNFEISGTVKNETEEGLENITVKHIDHTSSPSAKTDEEGEFVYEFKEDDYGDHYGGLQRTVSLKLKDDSGIYKEKEKEINISCVNTTPNDVWESIYECKKDGVEIIMEKIKGENPDTETDDESTDEE
jgi:hypothetical protein